MEMRLRSNDKYNVRVAENFDSLNDAENEESLAQNQSHEDHLPSCRPRAILDDKLKELESYAEGLNGTRRMYQKKKKKRSRTLSLVGEKLSVPRNSVCGGGTITSLASMRSGEASRKNTTRLFENPNLFARALSEKLTGPWIEHAFEKRECIKFVGQPGTPERCGCGRLMAAHSQLALSRFSVFSQSARIEEGTPWSIATHTQTSPTDAFGTIVFQGGAHAHKAQFIRLGYDSDPENVMYLMEKVWGLQSPKLVITVHGGMSNFEVQEKLGGMFRDGLLKAAQTTGAWIITGGLDSGVVKHVAQALDDAGISARMRSKIVTIGIAPWGVIRRRERLIVKDGQVQYDPHAFGSSHGMGVLNDRHSYFLLADNGTSSRYGADLHLRQNLENFLAGRSDGDGSRKVPVVCAVLEGGTNSLTAIHQYLTQEPNIPVIVCDCSGRASDLLAFASRYLDADGSFPDEVREQLLSLISTVFPDNPRSPQQILDILTECARKTDLLTIFRYGESRTEDVDHAILTAVLKRQNLSLPEQLSLTLSWNRVDVARSCLFSGGRHWPIHALHSAMNDALRLNRVDFVECLLENGVSMKSFLTIATLEQLYNLDDNAQHSVRFLVEHTSPTSYLTLPDIGMIVEKLMGNAYKHYYTSRVFKNNYEKFRKKAQLSRLSSLHIRLVARTSPKRRKSGGDWVNPLQCDDDAPPDFAYPFNDLILWAVLTRRPEMAKCMWLHGEDAMAKSLVAAKLYKAIARIAEEDYLEMEVAQKLREYCESSCSEALHLLDFCYREDNGQTLKLLTAQLPHWGYQNCLSLAVMANHKPFLAHPCCQRLLAELWHGSLRVRSGTNLRVLAALVFPPAALALAYKAPHVHSRKEESHSDESTTYDTISTCRTDRLEGNSAGSMMSLHLHKLFKTATSRARSGHVLSGDELDELVENGVGTSEKVTIMTSKKNSGLYGSTDMLVEQPHSLSALAKMRAFYSAPITKFWSWCIAFVVFLMLSSYVLLIETPVNPTFIEYATLAYIVVYTVEHIRKLFDQETPKLKEKCRVFYTKYYNLLTATALLLFLVGFGFRMQPAMRHSYGRVILSCSNVLWYMKVLEYLSVHPLLGPYIQMAAKMVVSMCYIIVLLLVTLMAFGVSRQAITYPHEKWNWLLVRNIFYKPYFMLYGEVYAGEIDTCGDEGTNCVPGGWIPPVLMTIFLLVANILLINMLIAIFNNIFNDTNIRSHEVWLFQRYGQVMEYNGTPLLPPPFTALAYIARIFCFFSKKKPLKTGKERDDVITNCSMRLYLSAEELRELHDFEEDCMDELTRRRIRKEKGGAEDSWLNALEMTELTSQRVNELLQENCSLKSRLCDMEARLDLILRTQAEFVDMYSRRRKQSKTGSSRASTQSLPEADDNRLRRITIAAPEISPLSINDQSLLSPVADRNKTASPLISHLRMDQTLRKYDEARYQHSSIGRRARLNSSSFSLSQDMRDMDRSHRTGEVVTSDDDAPSVVVHEPWEDSS